MDSRPIAILLADEHTLFREALHLTLSHSPHIRIIGQCGNGPDALRLFGSLHPDLLLLDITMQPLQGFTTTAEIIALHPDAKIIWMSAFYNTYFVRKIPGSGIRGYISKSMPHQQMIEAIRKVAQGGEYLPDDTQNPGPPR